MASQGTDRPLAAHRKRERCRSSTPFLCAKQVLRRRRQEQDRSDAPVHTPDAGFLGEKNKLKLMSPRSKSVPEPGRISSWQITGKIVLVIRFQSSFR